MERVAGMSKQFLIQDPTHPYAARFIELLHHKYDYRAVCVYTDRRERLRDSSRFPILHSSSVCASYDALPSQFADLAEHLHHNHKVVAVVPYSEPTILGAAEMARRLGIGWPQTAVMRRFRDKFALKEHLRQTRPDIRINASRRVETVSEVLAARRGPAFERFVLKPNNGFANRDIGFFGSATEARDIAAYLERSGGTPLVMEEFIGGSEYFVNGQIDAQGNVIVVAAFSYQRAPANGRENIDIETRRVNYRDPMFGLLAGYAQRVMEGTGLLRSPFHLELKVNEAGPCLIEVGARLAGHGNAVLSGRLHGPRLDLFELAAHYYLHDTHYGPVPLDWNAYDSQAVRYVHGVAVRHERLLRIDGITEVEALPEFDQWVNRPQVGDRAAPTVDLLTMPWSLIIKAPTESAVDAAAAAVRRTLRYNDAHSALISPLVRLVDLLRRGPSFLRNRLLRLPGPGGERFQDVRRFTWARALAARARQEFYEAVDALILRAQISRFWPLHDRPLPAAGGATDAVLDPRVDQVLAWAQAFLVRPHPMLGRKGPVCPFVQRTMDQGGFLIRIRDDVDGSSAWRLRRAVLEEARAFARHCPREDPAAENTSLVVMFAALPEKRMALLDRVHDQLKTYFMENEVMSSPFHPRCTKPSLINPDFEVFRAPFAAFAIRHMVLRDIVFVGSNGRTFLSYCNRFGALYDQGKVSDEFGYVRMFESARLRFTAPGT